jgi:hypothetical protein
MACTGRRTPPRHQIVSPINHSKRSRAFYPDQVLAFGFALRQQIEQVDGGGAAYLLQAIGMGAKLHFECRICSIRPPEWNKIPNI